MIDTSANHVDACQGGVALLPSPRLLLLAGVVFTPLLGVVFLFSGVGGAGLVIFLLVVLAGLDGARLRIPERAVTVCCPDRLQLICGRSQVLTLNVHRPSVVALRVCPLLPEGISGGEVWRQVAGDLGEVALSWELTGRRRGFWRLSGVAVETVSPWGLWAGRQVLAGDTELLVYPELRSIFRENIVLLRQNLLGNVVNRLVGQGHDFEKLREYQPGDTFADLDWKATARRGSAIVREYQVEQRQSVYLVLDGSRLSLRPTVAGGGAIFEQYIRVACGFSETIARLHDSLGLAVFASGLHTFCRAAPGLAQRQRLLKLLVGVQAERVVPDLDEICARLQRELPCRSQLIFLLNLDDPVTSSDFVRHVRLLRVRHCVTACLLVPAEIRPIFSGDLSESLGVHEDLAGHQAYRRLRCLQLELRAQRIDVLFCREQTLMGELTQHYLRLKRRQQL